MQAHAMGLIEKHTRIYSLVPIRAAQASYELGEVWIPPIKSSVSYAVALHEIGHICGRHRASRYRMVRERDAWSWAKTNALGWTETMERHRDASLAWYEAQIKIGSVSRFVLPAVEFIAENGGGPGVRLKKARRTATKPKKGD
jgi:hypothetical protein